MNNKNVSAPRKKELPQDKMKYEIATELGLMDKVAATGWRSLTARESGRIGGLMKGKVKPLINEK